MGAGPAGNSGSNDTEVSAYEREITKQRKGKKNEINKGVNVTTYGERETGTKPADYNIEKDDAEAKLEVFKTKGATDIENKNLIGTTGILKEGFKKGSVATRTMFIDDVLTSKRAKTNIGYTQDEFKKLSSTKQEEVYKSYLDNRTSGATDAYGNVSAGYSREKVVHTNKDGTKEFKDVIMKIGGGGGGDNQARANVVTEKKVGGKTILTTEGKVAEEKTKSDKFDPRKVKKQGRKRYTLTSSKGVTKVSDDYSLGKKSLLGTV
tara:strand:+ start:250 stop:1041 length:792 start_codon:yes stop_codon:yes gene_type:complete